MARSGRSRFRAVKHKQLYLLLIVPMAYIVLFAYVPMVGLTMAFERFSITKGMFASPWIGLSNFQRFFSSVYFTRTVRNTFFLSVLGIVFNMPFSILLALCLNELRNGFVKRFVQLVTYAPYFISTVVMVSMLSQWTEITTGLFNHLLRLMGSQPIDFMGKVKYFRFLYTASGIWQYMGFNSIVYLAAFSGIDQQLHEAAIVDGASRLQRVRHIDLPGIMPTIVIMLILSCGRILSVGFEKVYLMQKPSNLEHSKIISTYLYEIGLKKQDISYGTAVGMFNSIVNFILVVIVNGISKRMGETSLW